MGLTEFMTFSNVAYLIMSALRRIALKGTELAAAQCSTIRLNVLKIGAQVRLSVRRIYFIVPHSILAATLTEEFLVRVAACETDMVSEPAR